MLHAKLRLDSSAASISSAATPDQPVVLAHGVLSQLQSGRESLSAAGLSAPHSLLYLLSHSLGQFPIDEVLSLYQLPFPLPPQVRKTQKRTSSERFVC